MKIRLTLTIPALFILLVTSSFVAQAQANRTFVSGNSGTDAGLCPRTAPCKTLNYAHSVTNEAGEIVVIESDGVGQLNITKSITVMADPGHIAFIKAQPGTAAITVNAGVLDVVNLRNLQLNGQDGANTTGILDSSGNSTLHVEGCVLNGFTTDGIAKTGAGNIFIKDTIVRNGLIYGIRVEGSGAITGSIDRCRVENIRASGGIAPGYGVWVGNNAKISVSHTVSSGNSFGFASINSGSRMMISDSTAEGNSTHGFHASAGNITATHCRAAGNASHGFRASGAGVMTIDSSVSAHNGGNGIQADATGTVVRVANTTAVDNTLTGLAQLSGSSFISRGNNTVYGNNGGGVQTAGTITIDASLQ